MDLGPPDVLERKGALTLRSHCVQYGRPTLVYRCNHKRLEATLQRMKSYALPDAVIHYVFRHQNREAEPKDYDINEVPLGSKNLCQSTYSRFGTVDETWITTYQDHLSQPYTYKGYKEIEICKSMLNEDNFEDAVIDRQTGLPQTGVGAVLPRHPSDHFKIFGGHLCEGGNTSTVEVKADDKIYSIDPKSVRERYLDTTYRIDYVPPYDYTPYVGPQTGDYSIVHRKCHSQFTDTADYRRHGINTWQDESGIYANADIKQKVFPVTNPIPSNVPEDYF